MPTNTFENTDLVVREAIEALDNSLVCAKMVDRSLEGDFRTKVGDTIWKRRPYYFVSTTGAVVSGASDIEEGKVAITVDQRKHVNIAIDTADLALEIEDSRIQKIIDAIGKELAQDVESSIMDAYKGVWGYANCTSGLTLDNVADADAYLDGTGVNLIDERFAMITPASKRALAKLMATAFAFPSTSVVDGAMKRAMVGEYSNVMIYQNQSVATHTSGVATGTPLINGASQNVTYATARNTMSQSLITDGWTNSTTGILKEGDVITIAGVYAINRGTKAALSNLQPFVVGADADSGASTGPATLTISPPIISSGAYQTVSAAPADGAEITVLTGAAQSRRENLLLLKDCVNLAMVPLPAITAGAQSSSAMADPESGIAMRVTRDFDYDNDQVQMRFDILYGVTVQNGYYGYRLATAV
jgi:hypothetical protein